MRHFGHLSPWLPDGPPEFMAELGPGSSLGVGIVGLLAGVRRYYALDLERHRKVDRDLNVLHELVTLFRNRAEFRQRNEDGQDLFPPFPGESVWRRIEDSLPQTLSEPSIREIEAALVGLDDRIRFIAPWTEDGLVEPGSIDWLMSHSVMEHVDDLAGTYRAIARWLKPGGFATHLIDFQSHRLTREWNGHWTVHPAVWALLRGRRPYLINRMWRQHHVSLMQASGFEVLAELKYRREDGLGRGSFRAPFSAMPDGDERVAMSFFVTRKVA